MIFFWIGNKLTHNQKRVLYALELLGTFVFCFLTYISISHSWNMKPMTYTSIFAMCILIWHGVLLIARSLRGQEPFFLPRTEGLLGTAFLLTTVPFLMFVLSSEIRHLFLIAVAGIVLASGILVCIFIEVLLVILTRAHNDSSSGNEMAETGGEGFNGTSAPSRADDAPPAFHQVIRRPKYTDQLPLVDHEEPPSYEEAMGSLESGLDVCQGGHM